MQVKCPKCGQPLRVSEALLGKTAKGLTGRWITNFGAANLGKAALVCGLVGLIPFLGFILFLPALLMGGIAAATLLGRGVDKGKTMAIAGAVLGVVDLVMSVAVAMSAN